MSKSREGAGAARRQQGPTGGRRKKGPPISVWQRIPTRAYVLGASLLVLGLAIGLPVYFSQRHMSSPAPNLPSFEQPARPAPAPVQPLAVARVSGPAPGFSLSDPYGKNYTLTPGDGRAHLLVFYMGNF